MLYVFLIVFALFALIFVLDRCARAKRLAPGTLWEFLGKRVRIDYVTRQYVYYTVPGLQASPTSRVWFSYHCSIAAFEEKAKPWVDKNRPSSDELEVMHKIV